VTARAKVAFADLQVEFSSTEAGVIDLVRRATHDWPSVEGSGRQLALHANLTLGPEARWLARGPTTADAASPLDIDDLAMVLRAAMCQALAPEGALIHAAGIAIDQAGFLFVAPSGGGKTTISRLFSRQADVLSDDAVCVRPDRHHPGHYCLYGTSFWSGPAYPSRAGAVPLRGIFFLRKGPLAIEPLPPHRALRELLSQMHLSPTADSHRSALELATRLLARTPGRIFSFPLSCDPTSLLVPLAA
jgi:hypothetical protein